MAVDVREETIFTLFGAPAARVQERAAWWWLFALTLTAWLGAVAFIGRYRQHEVVQALEAIAPGRILYLGAIVAVLLLAVAGLAAGRRKQAGASLVVLGFLIGHQLYAWLYPYLPVRWEIPFDSPGDALPFAVSRLAYGAALVLPMLIGWFLLLGRREEWPPLTLGIGNLRAVARDVSRKTPPIPWSRHLLGGYTGFCIVFFFIMQANVGFRPMISGSLWPFIPAVLLAAVANALAEEFIFRGMLQPAFIRAGGIAAGLWMQGLMFGLFHWGMSMGILAALPVSLLIGLGSVVWGKAALDTGGMAWVVLAHTLVDIGLMSAFFVPRA
ncbi:MAG: CPBP family intramembrane glutamic endopeptidase [Longimicrobiales bacterium]